MELNAESNRSVEGLQLRLEEVVNFFLDFEVIEQNECLEKTSPIYGAQVSKKRNGRPGHGFLGVREV